MTSFTGQSDAETSGASLGVGFNAVNSSGGTFSYSTDNNTWYTLIPANFSSNPYVLLSPTTYLRLQANADNAGQVVFNMKLWDGTGTASTNTTPSATTSANTAPSLDTLEISGSTTSQNDAPPSAAAPYALTTTNEDTTSSGTLVSTILTGVTYADVDTGSIKGMAVTATTGNGTWQYSTDGTTWNGMGSVSASGALLLSSSTQVRYIPDNANGETPFTFRGWDTTNGTTTNNTTAASTNSTRATADTTTTGGSTAFSTGTAQASLSVTAVNDTPTDIALSNGSVGFRRHNATVGTLSSTDVDTGDTFTYSLVSGTGSTDNALFNFSGNTLRANDASALTAGTCAIRVRTTDSGSLTFEKAITLTVTDALTVTTIQDSGSDATTGGSYAAELADGAGLSLREALALASAGNKTIGFAAGLSGQTITLGSNATVPGGTTFDADAANPNRQYQQFGPEWCVEREQRFRRHVDHRLHPFGVGQLDQKRGRQAEAGLNKQLDVSHWHHNRIGGMLKLPVATDWAAARSP
ncbi:MAG: hypothetical protein IPJ18_19850 [Betaproteobacteria bacterium]|nr:hypothetical protein [Betaproteobacteria bacterium]